MLNEVTEYNEYISTETAPDSNEGRLKYGYLIMNNLSGLERAFMIIARKFLFLDQSHADNVKVETAIEALKAWCGFYYNHRLFCESSLREELKALDNGLLNYLWYALCVSRLKQLKDAADNNKYLQPIYNLCDNESISTSKDCTEFVNSRIMLQKLQEKLFELRQITTDIEDESKLLNAALKNIFILQLTNIIKTYISIVEKEPQYVASLFPSETVKKKLTPISATEYQINIINKDLLSCIRLTKLKDYYLVCGQKLFENIECCDTSGKKGNNTSVIDDTTKVKLLELMSMSLLLQDKAFDGVISNRDELKGWMAAQFSEKWIKEIIYRDPNSKQTVPLLDENQQGIGIAPSWYDMFSIIQKDRIYNSNYTENHSENKIENCLLYRFPIGFDKSYEKENDNDFKLIRFEKIVASALEYGPLKAYCLKQTNALDFKKLSIRSNSNTVSMKESDNDFVLKTTAAYLLAKRAVKSLYDTDPLYVIINTTDLRNWCRECDKKTFDRYLYNEEPLFDVIKFVNVNKLKINEKWIENFELIEINDNCDFSQPDNGCIYYTDPGSNKFICKSSNV